MPSSFSARKPRKHLVRMACMAEGSIFRPPNFGFGQVKEKIAGFAFGFTQDMNSSGRPVSMCYLVNTGVNRQPGSCSE